jgi:hypothetical protein
MDILKTFGPLIGSVAPTIATALGGPIAGMAIKALSGALFGHEDGTEEDIMTALANPTGDQLTALKKIDADFKIQMKQLDIDLVRITVDDRKSARDMQVVTKSWLVPTLATMIIAAFIAVTFATLMGYAKIESALAGTLVGYISAKAELVLSFYFGSSAGSEKKDEMLYKSTPGS